MTKRPVDCRKCWRMYRASTCRTFVRRSSSLRLRKRCRFWTLSTWASASEKHCLSSSGKLRCVCGIVFVWLRRRCTPVYVENGSSVKFLYVQALKLLQSARKNSVTLLPRSRPDARRILVREGRSPRRGEAEAGDEDDDADDVTELSARIKCVPALCTRPPTTVSRDMSPFHTRGHPKSSIDSRASISVEDHGSIP